MADTTALKNRIRAAIKANDNQEITGPVLQQALLDMVDELNGATETESNARQTGDSTLAGMINAESNRAQEVEYNLRNAGYAFGGIAVTNTNPNPVTANCFYIVRGAGTYTYFKDADNESIILENDGIYIFTYESVENQYWEYNLVIGIENTPVKNSKKIVTSDGILGFVYFNTDPLSKSITEYNAFAGNLDNNGYISVYGNASYIIIPVKANETLQLKAADVTKLAFVKSFALNPELPYTLDLCDGTTVVPLQNGASYSRNIPSDAKYLLLSKTVQSGADALPVELIIGTRNYLKGTFAEMQERILENTADIHTLDEEFNNLINGETVEKSELAEAGSLFKVPIEIAAEQNDILIIRVDAANNIFSPAVMNLYSSNGTMLVQFSLNVDFEYTVQANVAGFYIERATASNSGEVHVKAYKEGATLGILDRVSNLENNEQYQEEEIANLHSDVYGIIKPLPEVKLGNLNYDGYWNNVATGFETLFIKVDAGDAVYIAAKSYQNTYFGYLTNNDSPVAGSAIPYVSGYSRISLQAAEEYSGTVPRGCQYLAVLNKYNNSETYAPRQILINGKDPYLDESSSGLITAVYPKCVVSYSVDTNFKVYMQDKNDKSIYYMLEMNKVVNNTDIVYLNMWRIASTGGVYRYNGERFNRIGTLRLLAPVENEFAMKFTGKADFTGGYHGDERVDTEGSFAKFFVDGIELTSAELLSDFTLNCNSFYMLQKTTLHDTTEDGTTHITGHPIIGTHVKKTEFYEQGYKVTNRVDFDFTAASYSSKGVNTWFSGLCCVSKDCAKKLYGEDYVIHVAQNDGSSINIGNVLGSAVNFWSDTNGMSCEVKSKVITEDDAACSITVWDRALPGDSDEKYYRYAPVKTVTTGDIFKSEMKVKWQYHKKEE